MKVILEFLAKNNRWAIVLVLLLFVVGGGLLRIQQNKIKEWKNKHQTEVKLRTALTDSVRYYQDEEENWVAEKLTLQASVKDLESDKVTLTSEQRRLIDKVIEANKENTVITAALVRADFIIDSLMNDSVVVDTTNKTAEFIEVNNPDIQYNFKAFGVLPYPPDTKPTLLIKNLTLPNEAFIKFQWDEDKRANYPITFSITNSNDYVKVSGMNSYAIPELDKVELNPTGWQKVGQWFNKNGKIVGFVAGGVAVGAGATYVIMQ